MEKMFKIIKIIAMVIIGFVAPIHSVTEPDETTYRCGLKGITSSNGYLESWKQIFVDTKEYIQGGK